MFSRCWSVHLLLARIGCRGFAVRASVPPGWWQAPGPPGGQRPRAVLRAGGWCVSRPGGPPTLLRSLRHHPTTDQGCAMHCTVYRLLMHCLSLIVALFIVYCCTVCCLLLHCLLLHCLCCLSLNCNVTYHEIFNLLFIDLTSLMIGRHIFASILTFDKVWIRLTRFFNVFELKWFAVCVWLETTKN